MIVKEKRSNRGNFAFDRHGCFHIKDFRKGDNLLLWRGNDRIRGVVEGVNYKRASIKYHDADKNINFVNINDVILLQKPEPGWIK